MKLRIFTAIACCSVWGALAQTEPPVTMMSLATLNPFGELATQCQRSSAPLTANESTLSMAENHAPIINEKTSAEADFFPSSSRLTSVMLKGLRFSSKFVLQAADFLVSVFTASKINSSVQYPPQTPLNHYFQSFQTCAISEIVDFNETLASVNEILNAELNLKSFFYCQAVPLFNMCTIYDFRSQEKIVLPQPTCFANETIVVPKPGLCYPICHADEMMWRLSHQSEPTAQVSRLLSEELPVCLANETIVMPKPEMCYPICHRNEMMMSLLQYKEPVSKLDSSVNDLDSVYLAAIGILESVQEFVKSVFFAAGSLIMGNPILLAFACMNLALWLSLIRWKRQVGPLKMKVLSCKIDKMIKTIKRGNLKKTAYYRRQCLQQASLRSKEARIRKAKNLKAIKHVIALLEENNKIRMEAFKSCETMQASIANLSENVKSCQDNLKNSEKKFDKRITGILKHIENIKSQQKNVNDLGEENFRKLCADFDSMKAKMENSEASASKLQGQNDEILKKSLKSTKELRAKCDKMEAVSLEWQAELRNCQNENKALKKSLKGAEELSAKFEKLEGIMSQLQQALQASQDENKALKNAFETSSAQKATEISGLLDKVTAFTVRFDELQGYCQSQQLDIESLRNQNATLLSTVDALKKDVVDQSVSVQDEKEIVKSDEDNKDQINQETEQNGPKIDIESIEKVAMNEPVLEPISAANDEDAIAVDSANELKPNEVPTIAGKKRPKIILPFINKVAMDAKLRNERINKAKAAVSEAAVSSATGSKSNKRPDRQVYVHPNSTMKSPVNEPSPADSAVQTAPVSPSSSRNISPPDN